MRRFKTSKSVGSRSLTADCGSAAILTYYQATVQADSQKKVAPAKGYTGITYAAQRAQNIRRRECG